MLINLIYPPTHYTVILLTFLIEYYVSFAWLVGWTEQKQIFFSHGLKLGFEDFWIQEALNKHAADLGLRTP